MIRRGAAAAVVLSALLPTNGLAQTASATGATEPPPLHAAATCAPASKPGRIRCRAVLELPLERAGRARIAWAELRISGGSPSVVPLRGRLGPLDAETRDDARLVWSFSVAASASGQLPMDLRLLATVEARPATGQTGPTGPTAPLLVDQRLRVTLEVAAP